MPKFTELHLLLLSNPGAAGRRIRAALESPEPSARVTVTYSKTERAAIVLDLDVKGLRGYCRLLGIPLAADAPEKEEKAGAQTKARAKPKRRAR